MIKIDDRFSIKRDKYQWHLQEHYCGKTKSGLPKDQFKTTYHSNLSQVLSEIMDRRAGDCQDLSELRLALASFRSEVQNIVDKSLAQKGDCK